MSPQLHRLEESRDPSWFIQLSQGWDSTGTRAGKAFSAMGQLRGDFLQEVDVISTGFK